MKNTYGKQRKIKGYFLAFLVTALVFFAVGLGTLGSFIGTGNAYELRAKQKSDDQTPSVVFKLSNLTEKDKDGKDQTVSLRLVGAYLNIAQIYAEAGTPTTLRLERSTGGSSFSSGLNAVIENFYTQEGTPSTSTGGSSTPVAKEAFYRYVSPFSFPESGWRVSTYSYVRLTFSSSGNNPSVLLNEVVFLGEKLDSSYEGTGKFCVVPAEIYEATPYANESAEEARIRAASLLDAQVMPEQVQSSFFRFSKAELASLMTISEMRMGREFIAGADGKAIDTYHVDNVYGALGNDILALGTLIFGMCPFGLRFFPMLAAFGVLVVLSRLIVKMTGSEKAGFIFSIVYSLSCLTLGYGHLGTPLMLGVFFYSCALSVVYRFFKESGLKAAMLKSALPLLGAGFAGAAAICVNGAFVIPLAGVVGLFVAGMVRQNKVKNSILDTIIAQSETQGEKEEEGSESLGLQAGKVVAEYKFKNTVSAAFLGAGLVFGTFLLMLIGTACGYFAYLKAFDNPASPTMNVFVLAWKTFANGFIGTNYGTSAHWLYTELYRGLFGSKLVGVTAALINPMALLAGIAGLVFAIYRFVVLIKKKELSVEFANLVVLTGALLLSVVAALAVKSGAAFILLSYLFAFLLGANALGTAYEGRAAKAVKIVNIAGLVLLAAAFLFFAVLVFSVPLPEGIFPWHYFI